jgi:hypothetical protein
MSHVTIVNRSQLFAAATAISAVGFLTIPTPAQAHPMLPLAPLCHQYQFPGNITLRQDNGEVVLFSSYGLEARGPATATGTTGVPAQGTVSGGMNGLKNVDFTIHFNDAVGGQIHYTGTVSDDGYVHGGVVTGQLSGSHSWDLIERPLACVVDPAPPPPPIRLPESNTATLGPKPSLDLPAPAPVPGATVTSDVDVYDVPGGNGNKIGILRSGNKYKLATDNGLPAGPGTTCKPKDWCHLVIPEVKGGNGWVWDEFLQFS